MKLDSDHHQLEEELNKFMLVRLSKLRDEIPEELLGFVSIFPVRFEGVFTGRSGAIDFKCKIRH